MKITPFIFFPTLSFKIFLIPHKTQTYNNSFTAKLFFGLNNTFGSFADS